MESILFQYDFNDFDLFVETIHDWQLDFCQLDKGSTECNLFQIINERVIVCYFRANRSIKQVGAPPERMWTFSLLTPRSPIWVWEGHEVTSGTMIVYRPGADFDCVSPPGFEVFTVSALPEIIGSLCDELEIPHLFKELKLRNIVRCPSDKFANLLSKTSRFCQLVRNLPVNCAGVTIRQDYENDLLRDVLTTLAGGLSVQPGKKSIMIQSVSRKINEYMQSNPSKMLTVHRLCKIANVTERTLQHNFQTSFGISPKSYLKAMSLNRVRQDFLNGTAENSCVSDIANKWGFWHMGQFAGDYRRMFGELPSETLNKK
jgi:AraC family ethanolamine operon transcriptional activator